MQLKLGGLLFLVVIGAAGTNVTLGALFPIPEFAVERDAALYAAEVINRDDPLPGGFVLNVEVGSTGAGDKRPALTHALSFVTDAYTVGVVGAAFSDLSEIVAVVCEAFFKPQLSYSSTSPALSNKAEFPFFARVVPPDTFQGLALASIVKETYGWPEVAVLGTSDSYGSGVSNSFAESAVAQGTRVSVNLRLPPDVDERAYSDAVQQVFDAGTRVIFVGMEGRFAYQVFSQAYRRGMLSAEFDTNDYIWLGTDVVMLPSSYTNFSTGLVDVPLRDALRGLIGTVPAGGSGERFSNFSAEFVALNKTVYPASTQMTPFASYAADAVFAFAVALRPLLAAGVAPDDPTMGSRLYQELLAVDFAGLTRDVRLLPNGDRDSEAYELFNLQANGAFVSVGRWNGSELLLTEDIVFPDGSSNPPVIVDPEPPPPPEAQSDQEDSQDLGTILASTIGATVAVLIGMGLAVGCLLSLAVIVVFLVVAVTLVLIAIVVVAAAACISLVVAVAGGSSMFYVTSRVRKPTTDVTALINYDGEVVQDGLEREFRELAYSDLTFHRMVGQGAFGKVYMGLWRDATIVAIKELSVQADEKAKIEFVNEANIMARLGNHPNVVRFLGAVTTEERFYMVTEFATYGSLLDVLRNDDFDFDDDRLIVFARDAAAGLVHLHAEGVVHRDIAARNFLVSEAFTVQVTDFGLSRVVEEAAEAGPATTRNNIGPICWMAPESLRDREYSQATDVYMFGGFLLELVTGGKQPYPGMALQDVIVGVTLRGMRPQVPESSPQVLYDLMQMCWREAPAERPPMSEIVHILSDELGGSSVEARLQQSRMNLLQSTRGQFRTAGSVFDLDDEPQDDQQPMYEDSTNFDSGKHPQKSSNIRSSSHGIQPSIQPSNVSYEDPASVHNSQDVVYEAPDSIVTSSSNNAGYARIEEDGELTNIRNDSKSEDKRRKDSKSKDKKR